MIRYARNASLALLLASPTLPGAVMAQGQPVTGTTQMPPAVAPMPAPPQPQPVLWSRASAEELATYIDGLGAEGLDPGAYQPARLRAAIASNDPATLNAVAGDTFMRVAGDLSGGSVRGDDRRAWYMPSTELDAAARARLAARVGASGGVAGALNALLPTHPQYPALRAALAATDPGDTARRNLIRTNMERWRWMPRDLGPRYVIVNVPAFTAALVENGRVVARHVVIVGNPRTPTPQLTTNAVAVTMNPWWNVPQSIVREIRGARGYEVTRSGGSVTMRQPPGPRNALGRLKIEMPNDHAIYLHDTPAQALFNRDVRALSHGCVRTQNIRDFAALLLEPTGGWSRARIDSTIETGRTTTARLATPVPVYIAYFTAAATSDGGIATYRDVYGRDAPVRTALNRGGDVTTAQAN